MRKKIEKNDRITEETIKIARRIFESSERLGIIFLLTKKEMSIEEIHRITGDFTPLISHHLGELERGWIIRREHRASKKGSLTEMPFKINKDIRGELIEIINSFLSIQNAIERYKKEKGKGKK